MNEACHRTKVVHVITSLDTGGAEMVLCQFLERCAALDIDNTVVVLRGPGSLSARAAKVATVLHLNMGSGLFLLRYIYALNKILRGVRPDVIHGSMYHANLMATLARFGTGAPLVWGIHHSLHEFRREKPATRWVIRANRWLSGKPDRITYNSVVSAAQHEAFGFRAEHRVVIPNGFDSALFRPDNEARSRTRSALSIATGSLVIGLVARWHPVKDHPNFLRAAALFARACPAAVFVLIGDGMDEHNANLMAQIKSHDLAGHVRLGGRRDDMAALNSAFDIATLSSWGEAFPIVLGEAMACGVPCVATDVGDVADIVGDTGVTVPAQDPEALAAGWATLADLGMDGLARLGMQARDRIVERYAVTITAQRYAAVYNAVSGVR